MMAERKIVTSRVFKQAPYWAYEIYINGKTICYARGYLSEILAQAACDEQSSGLVNAIEREAAAPTAPAVDPLAGEARPTLITVRDFVKDDYAAKVKAGECVVIEENVYDIQPYEGAEDGVTEAELASRERFYGTREMYFADTNLTTMECRYDREFQVFWRDPSQELADLREQNTRLADELARARGALEHAEARERAADYDVKMHKEQHAQQRENAQLLYQTLRKAAPDAYKQIESELWQNTNEWDKLMSEGRRWQQRAILAGWKEAAK